MLNIQIFFAPHINSLRQKYEKNKFPAPASALDPPHVLCCQRKEIQGEEANVIRGIQQETRKQSRLFRYRKRHLGRPRRLLCNLGVLRKVKGRCSVLLPRHLEDASTTASKKGKKLSSQGGVYLQNSLTQDTVDINNF